MKAASAAFATAALLSLASATLQAQTRSIVYGETTITLNPGFLQTLTSAGFAFADDNGTPLQNGTIAIAQNQGFFDLQSGDSELVGKGGYLVSQSAGNLTLRVLDPVYEETGPGIAAITGFLILNNKTYGRVPVFVVHPAPTPPTLPITAVNNTLTSTGLTLSLTSQFVELINQGLGQQLLTTSTRVADLSLFEVLNPNGR